MILTEDTSKRLMKIANAIEKNKPIPKVSITFLRVLSEEIDKRIEMTKILRENLLENLRKKKGVK